MLTERCVLSGPPKPFARAAPSSDWEGMVSLHRNSMGGEFFKYLDMKIWCEGSLLRLGLSAAAFPQAARLPHAARCRSCWVRMGRYSLAGVVPSVSAPRHARPVRPLPPRRAAHDAQQEQEALVALGAQLAALVEAYDRVLRDDQAMEAAAQSFGDLLQVRGCACHPAGPAAGPA